MRYGTVVMLREVSVTVGEDGVPRQMPVDSPCFANPFALGASAYAAARAAGLHADAQFQVRSCDYGGQQLAVVDGVAYDVERAEETGEFTVLTLARRLSSDDEEDDEEDGAGEEQP